MLNVISFNIFCAFGKISYMNSLNYCIGIVQNWEALLWFKYVASLKHSKACLFCKYRWKLFCANFSSISKFFTVRNIPNINFTCTCTLLRRKFQLQKKCELKFSQSHQSSLVMDMHMYQFKGCPKSRCRFVYPNSRGKFFYFHNTAELLPRCYLKYWCQFPS